MDVLGLLPGPALKSNGGACDILQGEAFAYGVSGSVAVVDVRVQPDAAVVTLNLHGLSHLETASSNKSFCDIWV